MGLQFLSGTNEGSYLCMTGDKARRLRRALYFACSAVLFADHGLAASEPVTAPLSVAQREVEVSSVGKTAFDIPAQSLASALEAYSTLTRREVLYNGKLAIGRESTGVKGIFTPETALQMLLEGTGLSPRYMAADAFVLAPSILDPRLVNTASPAAVAGYYGRIQAGFKHAFCANSRTQPGAYRVAVSFWIGSSGTVSRVELLGSTGDPDLDATIERTTRGLVVGAPPPHGFGQPVTIMVAPQTPGMTRDCQAAWLPVRAGPP